MHERVLGTIERYGLRRPVLLYEHPLSLVGEDTEVMEPYVVDRSFIDQSELNGETAQLYSALEQAFRLRSGTYVQLGNQKEATRWNKIRKRIDDLIEIGADHNSMLTEFENSNPARRSYLEMAVLHCVALGTEITLRNALRDELALAHKAGVGNRLIDFTKLVDFHGGFTTAVKIDGVSLENFTDPSIAKKSPVSFFQFLAIADTLIYRTIYDEIIQDNEGTLVSQYPNTAKWGINVLCTRVSLLKGRLRPQIFIELAKNMPQPLADAYRNGAKILEGVGIVREKSRKALLNLKDPDSAAIREITNVFLKSPLSVERAHILQTLGLNKLSILYSVYRQSYQLALGDNGEFYFDLAMAIRDYIQDISSVKDILNDEDIDSFLLANDESASSDKTLEDQIKLQARYINRLTSQTSQRFFEVNPAEVALGNLAMPHLIEITLDKNRPRKFTVNLTYNNELDEEVEIEYTIDTTRGTFDWNFLEDPTRPENAKIATMRSQLAQLGSTLLGDITSYETKKRQKVSCLTQASTQEQAVPIKRERLDDPIYTLRKQVRSEQRTAKAQETEEIDVTPAIEKGRVKNAILLDDKNQAKIIHVGIEDEQAAFGSIREYNERGIGKFTRKRKRGPDGKPRYTLRAGNIRVLMEEVDSTTEGTRNFEILDIRYRKDIYPKNEL